MKILAIESSCDETAAAVVEDGTNILSNVINTQIALHKIYGGVVPEIASRKHIENISAVIDRAMADSGYALSDMDAIAVTYGPGLVGALLVGVSTAKALSFALSKPLIFVLPFFVWWPPAATATSFWLRIMRTTMCLQERGMTRPARHLIRFPESLGLGIPAVRRFKSMQKTEIPTPFIFPVSIWESTVLTLALAV